MRWRQLVNGLHQQESGQDLLEYALILGTVLVAVVAGSETLATVITGTATKLGGKILSLVQ